MFSGSQWRCLETRTWEKTIVSENAKKVFVVGCEPFNFSLLDDFSRDESLVFRELLSLEEAEKVGERYGFADLLELSERRIAAEGGADAILNYWDFPGCCLAPVLCRRLKLPGARPEAVAACEHKYLARSEMAKAVPEFTPGYCAVDPFGEDPEAEISLAYPYWLKPIVSHSSYLGFKISSKADLEHALARIREEIAIFGNPFNEFLEVIDAPKEAHEVSGLYCIAEEIISAETQVTLEGYVHDGQVTIYGEIDSIRDKKATSCFARYEYPSRVPSQILDQMKMGLARFLAHIGYDGAPFNAEFFWDKESGRISLLEVNTRISKSHCPLFLIVDGLSHQKVALDLALGREPRFGARRGRWPNAAKFMVRLFQDGELKRVPNAADVRYVQARYPEALIQVLVKEGERLSNLKFQDSYSFEIADIFLGGESDEELQRKYSDIMELLPFEVHLTAPAP